MVIIVASYSSDMRLINSWETLVELNFIDVPYSVVVTNCDGTLYDKKPTNNWFQYNFCDIQSDYITKYFLIRQTTDSQNPYYFFDNSTSEYGVWNMFGKLIKKIKKRVPISVNKLEHDINSNYLNKVVGIMTEMKTRLMNSEVEKKRLESEVQQLKTNMSKKIQVAVYGARGVGKTTFIVNWMKDYPEMVDRCRFFEFDSVDNQIKYDWIILLYDRTNIHETLTYLQNLDMTNTNSDHCFLIMNKCDLDGEPIDKRHRFKYGNSIIPTLGQYYHSCNDGKRYTVNENGKSIVWDNLPKCKTTYDCFHTGLPEEVEKLSLMCELESQYVNMTDRTSYVGRLVNEIITLKTKNVNLENDIKAMTEKFQTLKKNVRNILS